MPGLAWRFASLSEVLLLWGLGLLAASLLLVVIELFVPSGGMISLISVTCALAGVYCLFRHSTTWGLAGLGAMLILGPLTLSFALKVWPNTPIGRRMMGDRPEEEVEAEQLAAIKDRERLASLVGAEGIVRTDLRPLGVIEIDGRRYDAISEVSFIRVGTRVRVSVAEANQLRVRPIV